MSSKPVAIIFGVGANIGSAIVKKFVGAGYRVAAVSRSAAEPPALSADGTTLPIRADVAHSAQISAVFDTVRKTWNTAPKVVVYNPGSLTPPPDKDNIFSVPVSDFEKDLAVNVTSPWVAAFEAVKGWSVGERATFILTGNCLPKVTLPVPSLVTLGVGKAAASNWLALADATYKKDGWR